MLHHFEVEVTLAITNREDIERMRRVREVLEDVAEDMPWRMDVKEAIGDFDKAMQSILEA